MDMDLQGYHNKNVLPDKILVLFFLKTLNRMSVMSLSDKDHVVCEIDLPSTLAKIRRTKHLQESTCSCNGHHKSHFTIFRIYWYQGGVVFHG